MATYHGSCHGKQICFEIDSVIERVTACNCSVCTKKGMLHHRVAPENFRLLAGAERLATYRFGTGIARHHYCPDCGIHVFSRPRAAPELYTVNVRRLDDFDPETAQTEIVRFDGRHWEEAVHQFK